ncbi:hypothetical protein BDB01DRAFT_785535 [Pilobolus umbonatus]|nr:hypothetical protein BDB01DRAFT_785535 [Pilobolus umbonatus]
MMDTVVSPLFDPKLEGRIYSVFGLISIVFILFILFLVFLTVRIDGIVTWTWAVVWIPAWILNIILFILMIGYIRGYQSEGETTNHSKYFLLYNQYLLTIRKSQHIINYMLILLFQIFIVIRLDNHTQWTACIIFIPYFLLQGIHFIMLLLTSANRIIEFAAECEKEKVPKYIYDTYSFPILMLIQCILIPLRIDGLIRSSWGIIFIPLYLLWLKWAGEIVYACYTVHKEEQREIHALNVKIFFILAGIMYAIGTVLTFVLVGFIARRLDGATYIKMSNIFIPLFIVFSFLLCCSGCCVPCMLMLSTMDMNDPEMQTLVNPNRRITEAGESIQ